MLRIKDILRELKDGDPVSNLPVGVAIAGRPKQVGDIWQQKIEADDLSGRIGCIVFMSTNRPLIKANPIVIEKATLEIVDGRKILLVDKYKHMYVRSEPCEYETKPIYKENKMPNVNDLKSSKFLTKEDCTPEVIVTIAGYEEVNVAMENQAPDMKWSLSFKELDKPLILNITNGHLIMAITGSGDFEDWMGKKIILYNDTSVMFAGKCTGGIRIKAVPSNPNVSDITKVERQDDSPPPTEDDIPF